MKMDQLSRQVLSGFSLEQDTRSLTRSNRVVPNLSEMEKNKLVVERLIDLHSIY